MPSRAGVSQKLQMSLCIRPTNTWGKGKKRVTGKVGKQVSAQVLTCTAAVVVQSGIFSISVGSASGPL